VSVAGQRRLVDGIDLSPIAMVISNPRRPDNPIEVANAAFLELTGYSEREVVGHNCRFLAGEDTDPATTEQIRAPLRAPRPLLVDILNYRHDGSAFRNGVMITPLFDEEGELEWFLGSQVDLGPGAEQCFLGRRSGARSIVDALPARQRQVLELMARGLLNKQIAWELKISEKTVKMHRALLIERVGVATSAEAIRLAVEAGL